MVEIVYHTGPDMTRTNEQLAMQLLFPSLST